MMRSRLMKNFLHPRRSALGSNKVKYKLRSNFSLEIYLLEMPIEFSPDRRKTVENNATE